MIAVVNQQVMTVFLVVREKIMRQSSKTALGGIIAALSLVLMLLSTVIPFLTYVLPAFAGAVLVLMVIEISKPWAFCTYIAVSLLSLLILSDKETAMMYVAFFGYYPILKNIFEKKLKRPIEIFCKFLTFNLAVIIAYVVMIYVFMIPIEGMDDFGKWTVPILLFMGNILLILYDIVLSRFIALYMVKLRKRFRSLFK